MIKSISLEDIPQCVKVIRESFGTVAREFHITKENAPDFTAFSTNEEKISRQFLIEHRPMFGCFQGGQLVGFYSLQRKDGRVCELNHLSVLPQFRKRGIGRQLLNHAFETAEKLGCSQMEIGIVEENQVLRKRYESNGFVHTGTEKFDFFPFTCGYMQKDLRAPETEQETVQPLLRSGKRDTTIQEKL